MNSQVIIAGAGPTGLMLAAELGLAGVAATVLEALPVSTGESRALGVNPRAVELWEQRGVIDRFSDGRFIPHLHYGALPVFLELDRLDSPYGVMMIPQRRTEEILGEWAVELGAEIRRGHRVTGLRQDADRVTVAVTVAGAPETSYELTAPYLVGCDGTRSAVRSHAGIASTGTPSNVDALMVDVSGLPLELTFFQRNDHGLWAIFPIGRGVFRVVIYAFDRPALRNAAKPTFSEVCELAERVAGLDLSAGTPHWLSRHGNVTRLASRYSSGRAFLVGDAAHTQPPAGGQGLTAGLHDAVNLGWKLAAAVSGWAPPGLLDSYHDERYPVGQRIMANARVQNLLMSGGAQSEALRTVLTELVALDDVNRRLGGDLAQLDVRYDLGDDHDLLGRRIPPAAVTTGDGDTSTLRLLSAGRGLLLRLVAEPVLDTVLAPWHDRVDLVSASSTAAGLRGLAALLVRPDGHVAWAAPAGTELDKDGLVSNLHRWFGTPALP